MNPPAACQATWIGHLAPLPAHGLIDESRVFGLTSRGIFLLLPPDRILFLSYEPFRGPLTVNLPASPLIPIAAQTGQACRIEAASISFSDGATVGLAGAQLWNPPLPPDNRMGAAHLQPALRALAALVLVRKGDYGLAPLLPSLLGLPSLPGHNLPSGLAPVATACEALARLGSLLAAAPVLEPILGLGRGLTPSGDDFIVGMLLALQRAPFLKNTSGQAEFSRSLCAAARQRTTALSTGLIEAAAQGSADERLVNAFDGLFSASLSPEDIFTLLSSYGSSSGIDALTGAVAITRALVF